MSRPRNDHFNNRPMTPGFINGAYKVEAVREMLMHSENVYHHASVAECNRRMQVKRYEAAREEMLAARAASGVTDRLPA